MLEAYRIGEVRMYEAMDSFLAPGTWHTTHPLDERRFNEALNEIVWRDDFNADDMADYIRSKAGGPQYEDEISRLQAKAHAIHDFLVAAGRV